jgi:hypothetical protein
MPTNGRPEPEVIVAVRTHLARSFAAPQSNISQFGDGFSYSKTKVEELVKNGFFEKLQKTAKEPSVNPKKDDVDLIVRLF